MSGVTLPQIPLGAVVAERHFILWDSEGSKHEIVVKLGAPVQIDTGSGPLFRCPAQILGLGVDQIVYAPAGEDAFIALCYALGQMASVGRIEGPKPSEPLQDGSNTKSCLGVAIHGSTQRTDLRLQ